jgi:hypothetical protein
LTRKLVWVSMKKTKEVGEMASTGIVKTKNTLITTVHET